MILRASLHLPGPGMKHDPEDRLAELWLLSAAAAAILTKPIILFYIKLPGVQVYPLISHVVNSLTVQHWKYIPVVTEQNTAFFFFFLGPGFWFWKEKSFQMNSVIESCTFPCIGLCLDGWLLVHIDGIQSEYTLYALLSAAQSDYNVTHMLRWLSDRIEQPSGDDKTSVCVLQILQQTPTSCNYDPADVIFHSRS